LLFNSLDPEIVNNILLSIQIHHKKLGSATINANERMIDVIEIEDSSFFNELESVLVHWSPKEGLLPSHNGDYAKIKNIVEHNRILGSICKKSDFNVNSTSQLDIERLLKCKKDQKKSIHTVPEAKLEIAMGSLAAGVKYLEVINEEGNLGKFRIQTIHIDGSAVTAFNRPMSAIDRRCTSGRASSAFSIAACKTNQ
jgi:hypothetical protein